VDEVVGIESDDGGMRARRMHDDRTRVAAGNTGDIVADEPAGARD